MKKVFNLTEVAEFTGIPKRTLHNMVRDGRFAEHIKGTQPKKWYVETVQAWLESR